MKAWIQVKRKMLSTGLLTLGAIFFLIRGRLPSAFVDLSMSAGLLVAIGGLYLRPWKADFPRVRRNAMILLGILAFFYLVSGLWDCLHE